MYDSERDRGLAARCVTDPRATGLGFLSLLQWIMGHPQQAQITADEAFLRAYDLGHANTTGQILRHAGAERAMLLRDVTVVRNYADAVMALAATHHMQMLQGYGLVFQGWAFGEEGQLTEGASLMRRGIGELDSLAQRFTVPTS